MSDDHTLAPPSPIDSTAAPAPQRYEIDPNDPRTKLRENVIEAVRSIPFYFQSPIIIEGLDAGDLFSLNTLLGGAIEVQTVDTLNRVRTVWDPEDEWQDYGFKRFPQSFPDVRLVRGGDPNSPALGIELKGWYLLSKEAEPSFRYKASAAASTEWDLLVCVPWTLSNVLSGTPRIHEPYIEQAKYAADMRTYYWQHMRAGDASSRNVQIRHPAGIGPYPPPGAHISDVPEADSGGNFGRLARINGLMTEWTTQLANSPVSGISARYWIEFLRAFSESNDEDQLRRRIANVVRKGDAAASTQRTDRVFELLAELKEVLP